MTDVWTGEMGQMFTTFLPRALLAIACGGLIGVEREIKQKPAGFRTNILICFGSMLFMWMSAHIAGGLIDGKVGDPGRIAAQVVTGIGFLGAGTILHSRGRITGLTSAAQIWVVSAIGMAIGAGMHAIAIASTALILIVQVVLGFMEQRLFGRCLRRDCEVDFEDDNGRTRREIEKALRAMGQNQEAFSLRRAGDHHVLTLQYCYVHPEHRKLLGQLWKIDGVREVRPLA
jgi:putative Mg2+ transporter-C (MgtC) family protein